MKKQKIQKNEKLQRKDVGRAVKAYPPLNNSNQYWVEKHNEVHSDLYVDQLENSKSPHPNPKARTFGLLKIGSFKFPSPQ